MNDQNSDNKLPVLTRNFPIDRWIESYMNYADQKIGMRTCPISYVLREDPAVPLQAPTLAANQPYSDEHGSLKSKMVTRFSQSHPLFSMDNGSVYNNIKEATCGSNY